MNKGDLGYWKLPVLKVLKDGKGKTIKEIRAKFTENGEVIPARYPLSPILYDGIKGKFFTKKEGPNGVLWKITPKGKALLEERKQHIPSNESFVAYLREKSEKKKSYQKRSQNSLPDAPRSDAVNHALEAFLNIGERDQKFVAAFKEIRDICNRVLDENPQGEEQWEEQP